MKGAAKMESIGQMVGVANSCPGYERKNISFNSGIGNSDTKSCTNCRNLQNGICIKDLYDKVLTSLDQT